MKKKGVCSREKMKGGGERAVKSERGSKENERQMESVSVCVCVCIQI